MSEETVQERIHQVVLTAIISGHRYPGLTGDSLNEYAEGLADDIIDGIRTAMLAPSTVKAAHKGIPPPVQIERVLTNALNEVFGENKP